MDLINILLHSVLMHELLLLITKKQKQVEVDDVNILDSKQLHVLRIDKILSVKKKLPVNVPLRILLQLFNQLHR